MPARKVDIDGAVPQASCMGRYVLIPGAGGAAWCWHRVVPLLERAGHEAIAVDLPGDDDAAGLDVYADLVAAAIGPRPDTILVAHSMGAFTAPMACARRPVARIVLVNAMVPVPGETPGDWWGNTRSREARIAAADQGRYTADFDLETYFFHDLPDDLRAQMVTHDRDEAGAAFEDPCRFMAWPDVPIDVIAGRDDRVFPVAFQRRIAEERLHRPITVIGGGHMVALSNPAELVTHLVSPPGK